LLTPLQVAPLSPHALPESVLVAGNNYGSVSFQALRILAEQKVPLTIFGIAGRPIGTWLPAERLDGQLRLAQMRCHIDPVIRLQVARALVEAKCGETFPDCRTISELRTAEGEAAIAWWQARGITRKSAFYDGTINAKATTPENAVFNVSFGWLYAQVRIAVRTVGLDPCVPFLHSPLPEKEGFVYDVTDVYRERIAETALRWYRGLDKSERDRAVSRDPSTWVYRVAPDFMYWLAADLRASFDTYVPWGGYRVSVSALMVRELRRLGQWFEKPQAKLRLASLRNVPLPSPLPRPLSGIPFPTDMRRMGRRGLSPR
jgi:hypothetical protein